MKSYKVLLAGQAPEGEYSIPLALGYLKAYADSQPSLKGRVVIALTEYRPQDPDAVAANLSAGDPNLVGFSCYAWNVEFVSAVAKRLKIRRPDVQIVVGGPETAWRGDNIIKEGTADFVVKGEGEATFVELLDHLVSGEEPSQVQGLTYLRESRLVANPPRPLIDDLDSIPCPYKTGVLRVPADYKGVVVIETVRGCPYGCAFCGWSSQGRRVRYFSAARVLETVRTLLEASPGITLAVADSDFFLQQERAKKLLRGFREAGEGKAAQWQFNVHICQRLDEELLRLSNWERCLFSAGVQSTNPEALRLANRPTNLNILERNLRMFQRLAPEAHLTTQLIYGLPGDTLAGYRKSLDWLLPRSPSNHTFWRLQVIPGSRFAKEVDGLGIAFERRPPYFVRSTRLYSKKDIAVAGLLSFEVIFLMSSPTITRLMNCVWEENSHAWSIVEAYEEIARRLESEGIFSLSAAYRRHPNDPTGYTDRLGIRWPYIATVDEQVAILRRVYEYAKPFLPSPQKQKMARLVMGAIARASWAKIMQQPSFGRLVHGLALGRVTGGKVLLVCWEDSLPKSFAFGADVSVVLLLDRPVDSAEREKKPVISLVPMIGKGGFSRLISAVRSLEGDYDAAILAQSCFCFAPSLRAQLLKELALRVKSERRLLVMEGSSDPLGVGKAALHRQFKGSGWENLGGPYCFKEKERVFEGEERPVWRLLPYRRRFVPSGLPAVATVRAEDPTALISEGRD